MNFEVPLLFAAWVMASVAAVGAVYAAVCAERRADESERKRAIANAERMKALAHRDRLLAIFQDLRAKRPELFE